MDSEAAILSQLVRFMIDTAILAGVPLAVATVVGFLVSFLQAITQIQDQTLSQTIKIAAIAFVMLTMASVLTGPLISSTRVLFENFENIIQ